MQYLFKENIKTKNDLEQAQVNFELAQATLKSAQSSLERTRINLSYASIYAPIDGIVIAAQHRCRPDRGRQLLVAHPVPDRQRPGEDADPGQRRRERHRPDQGGTGSALHGPGPAQPEFFRQVSQIRLEPTTVNNVVNYTVVVNVANEDGLLLPGMTATIDFLVGQAKNVLRVANAALRFKPNQEMRAGAR